MKQILSGQLFIIDQITKKLREKFTYKGIVFINFAGPQLNEF